MRALVQRVLSATVTIEVAGPEARESAGQGEPQWQPIGQVGQGLCVFVGATHDDTPDVARKMAEKLWHLRIMDDDAGVMNRSVADTTRSLLIVSQFTLYGDTSGGRRPSWIAAARPEHAEPLIVAIVDHLRTLGATVATGKFRTEMRVSLVNDGPVTVSVEL